MTTVAHPPTHRIDVLHPAIAALVGAAVFALAMTAGEVLDLNSDSPDAPSTTLADVLGYAGLVLAGAALAVWLGVRARSGPPDRLARYALGLALGSAATFVVFWSGWPQVLGAVAVALALEHRRRIGDLSALSATATALGLVALAASVFLCVVG